MDKKEAIEKVKTMTVETFFSGTLFVKQQEVIAIIEQIGEPTSGCAEEAPRYLRNILARLRGLPEHDREVWLKGIMDEFELDFSHAKWREGYEQGKFEGMIELEKVKVPQFVADWIEKCKTFKYFAVSLSFALQPSAWEANRLSDECIEWLTDAENKDLFARAWLDGYEVKQEKRYKVKLKSTDDYLVKTNNDDYHFYNNIYTQNRKHTRKELEDAGFGWVFDCEGVEVQEVQEVE